MVNFSANNQRFLNTETHPLPEGRRNAYKTRHIFLDLSVRRVYRFLEYHDTEAPKHSFSEGTVYVVTGKINVDGPVYYLVLETAKLDAKNNEEQAAEKLKRQVVPKDAP